MNEFERLVEQLKAWNGRRRWRDTLLWLPRTLLAGLLTAVLVAVVARLRPFLTNQELSHVILLCGLLGLLVGAVALLWQRRDLSQQARFADRQFHLKERATTAVEIQTGLLTVPTDFAQMQLRDTVGVITAVDTKALLPLQIIRRDWLLLLVAMALLITAVLLPNPQEEILLHQRAIEKTIAEQITALEALQEEILQDPDLSQEQKEELLQPIENAIEGLSEGGLSQEQAVATLSEAEAELRELSSQFSTEDLQRRLDEAGQPLTSNPNSQQLGQMLQNGNLSQAGAAAAQLADQLPELSAEELAQLAQDLAEAASALEGVDSELAQQFAEASQALQNGDVAAAQQALQEAAGTLQQRAQSQAAAQTAENAASQLNEGRQEVAQAGQEGTADGSQQGEGSGSDQSGQGQEGGDGSGQSGQGEGEGSSGDGLGQGSGQGEGNESGTGAGGPGPGGGHTENVFAPDWVDLSGADGVDIELPAECVNNPANCGALLNETATEFGDEASLVPYNQVFGDYRDAAYEALSDDYIPLGMKGYVRDYFSSLEPAE